MLSAACVVSPYQREVNATCAQGIPPEKFCTNGGQQLCGLVLLVELPFIGACEGVYFLDHQLGPAPAKSVHDGIYTAPGGAFSVQAPTDQPTGGYKIEQGSVHGLSYLSFKPAEPALPAYTVAVMGYHPKSAGDQPPESTMPVKLRGGVLGISYSGFSEVQRLRDPLPATVDGQSARLGIYVDADDDSSPKAYFLVYDLRGLDAQATVSISWSGPCPRCKEGTEAEILAGVPGAERFLKSFHIAQPATGAAP
jgi:hypothetical protein